MVTSRLKIATGICLIPQRDPIVTAKIVSSVDRISGGRFIFGIGAGWNEEEMRHHGTDPANRFQIMRERILAMKQIWTREEPAFDGRFVRFDPIWQWPKPVQKPHPPILVGGNGPRVLQRVIAYGDGWLPNMLRPNVRLAQRIPELQHLAEQANRGGIPVTTFNTPPDARVLEECRLLRVERCVFLLPAAGADVVLPRLDTYAELARQFA